MTGSPRIEYLLRAAQTTEALGDIIGVLNVADGSIKEETNRPSVLNITLPFDTPYASQISAGNVIQIIDRDGEFAREGAVNEHSIDYIIQTIRRTVGTDGQRVIHVEAIDYMGALAETTIPEYQALSEDDTPVTTILTDLLAFHNRIRSYTFALGTIDSDIGAQIRSVNIQNDTVLRALIRLQEMLGGYFTVRHDPAIPQWYLDWTAFPATSEKRLLLGHNVNGIDYDQDAHEQVNVLYLYGRGEGTARVEQPTIAKFPTNYWSMNKIPDTDSTSCHDITDNGEHMTEVNTPTYTQPTRSPNLVPHSNFAVRTGWTEGAGWAIDVTNRCAKHTPAGGGNLTLDLPDVSLKAGDTYELTFDVFVSAGSVTPTFAGVAGSAVSTSGVHKQTFLIPDPAPTGTPQLVFDATSDFALGGLPGFVWNVELRVQDEDVFGINANCIRLNGTSQYLWSDAAGTYRRDNQDWGVSMWFRIDSLPPVSSFEALWSDVSGAGVYYALGIYNNAGNTYVRVTNNGSAVATGTTALQAGVWYHVGLAYDSSGNKIYVFLNMFKEIDLSHTPPSTAFLTRNIGARSTSGGSPANYFDGWIDEVRLYNNTTLAIGSTTDGFPFRLNDFYDETYYADGYIKDDSSINTYGVIADVRADKSITNPDTLYPISRAILTARSAPVDTYKIDTMNLRDVEVTAPGFSGTTYGAIEAMKVNEAVRILDDLFDIDSFQIVRARETNLNNLIDVKLDLANVADTLVRKGNEVFDLQDLEQKAPTTVIGAGSIVIKGAVTFIDIFTGGTTTIDGGIITTGSITADKITVAELSALVAEVGQLVVKRGTGLGSNGEIKSEGVTSFNNGAGFFMDQSGNMFFGDSTQGNNLASTAESGCDGTLATSTNWSVGAGWSIGSGVATVSADNATLDGTIATLSSSKEYNITFEVLNWTTGECQILLGGKAGETVSGNGTYTRRMTPGTLNSFVAFRSKKALIGDPTPSFQIDNVEVRETSLQGNAVVWDGSTLTVRGDLGVSGTITADNIVAGTINVDRMPIRGRPDPDNEVLGAATTDVAQYGYDTAVGVASDADHTNYVTQTVGVHSIATSDIVSVVVERRYSAWRTYPSLSITPGSQSVGRIELNLATNDWNSGEAWARGETMSDPGSTPDYFPTSDSYYITEVFIDDLGYSRPFSLRCRIGGKSSAGTFVSASSLNRVRANVWARFAVRGATAALRLGAGF